MEKAGNEGNIDLINEKTDGLIEDYLKLRDALKKYFADETDEEKRAAGFDDIILLLDKMHEALDNFDTLQIDEVIEEMSGFRYYDKNAELFEKLKAATEDSDIESCLNIVNEWGESLVKHGGDSERTVELLNNLLGAIDEFDILKIDAVMDRIARHTYSGEEKKYFEELRDAAERSDIAQCTELAAEWKNLIKNLE